MKKYRYSNGSALVMVLMFTLVLSVLAGAVYSLFLMNTASNIWVREDLQAKYAAEAGANLAIYMIMGGSDVPQGTDPEQFLPIPPAGGWYQLPGELGEVKVVVDPNNNNDLVSSGNAYGIRCLGKVTGADGNEYFGMETIVIPENFARFATFLNQPGGGWYGDGYRFDGPFFCNGAAILSSQTVGRDNDVWFYTLGMTEGYYYYRIPASGVIVTETEPQVGNLWVEPYERMILGEPYFELSADSIPFGSDVVRWQDARTAAIAGGLYLTTTEVPNGSRMHIMNDRLRIVQVDGGAETEWDLGALSNPVVWIDNNPTDQVHLKTEPGFPTIDNGLTIPLTLGIVGDLMISGDMLYQNQDITDPSNNVIMGIIIVNGDFLIAHDPDNDNYSGAPDWVNPATTQYKMKTDLAFRYDCVVMVLDGIWALANQSGAVYDEWPHPAEDFTIMGGYIVDSEGVTTWVGGGGNTWGYFSDIVYDSRLMSMHPPYFPQTGRWDTFLWEERSNLTEATLIEDRY